MDKEELQDKENQNLTDENSELSTDKQAPDESKKKEEDENVVRHCWYTLRLFFIHSHLRNEACSNHLLQKTYQYWLVCQL